MVLRDKQVDNYNIFVGQDNIKHLLRNICFCLDYIHSHLNHMDKFVVSDSNSDSDSGGLTNPLVDPIGTPLDNIPN